MAVLIHYNYCFVYKNYSGSSISKNSTSKYSQKIGMFFY